MNRVRILSLLTSYYLCLIHAAPSVLNAARAADGSISSQCTNIEIRNQWLVADCLTGEDDSTRIQSATFLNSKVENHNGALTWKSDGWYSRSCKDCTLGQTDATLSCQCRGALGIGWQSTSISLDEHIGVYNGHLLSNLNGRVEPPSTPSKHPVPTDFRIRFGGNTTCPDADGPGTDFCRKQITGCLDTPPTDLNNTAWQFEGPVSCVVPVIYFPQYHYQFEVLRAVGQGAWVLEGFTNEGCEGEPDRVLQWEDFGKCNVMQNPIKGLRIRPGFNGDPN